MNDIDTITTALREARLSAPMIIEELTGDQWSGFDSAALRKAESAMAKYDRTGSAVDSAMSYSAAKAALATNADLAIEIIFGRVAARTAALAAPLSEGAQRALRGED